ncbi:MAG TPA: glycosyltransferase [Arenicellales bacterium]|nr:glycosyltransferase [Arenicellales bacterium]
MSGASTHPNRLAAGTGTNVSLRLHEDLPVDLELGKGQFLALSGECLCEGDSPRAVVIDVDGSRRHAELSPFPGGVTFWQGMFLSGSLAGRTVSVRAEVTLRSGTMAKFELGAINCRDVDWQPVAASGGRGLVAICMATYEPDLEAFRRQIDSIRSQDHPRWLCIVNDDGSSRETWERMRELCTDDQRFSFHRNPGNLGFYRNFESALKKVPVEAEYIAFADQDDFWYKDKLSRLIEALRREQAMLAYSDMRIVDASGAEVASTYWVNRRNEYRDLKVVLVANTVTGAASLFRRELLPDLVPFPPRVGDAFHDHWLACTAMSTGTVAYVDAPLHDYYQHGSSVIGHCDFTRFTAGQRLMSLLRLVLRMCRPSQAGPWLRGKYTSALAVYRGECRRLRLVQETIKARCRLAPGRRADLRLFDGGIRSLARLLALHACVLWKGQTTDDAELRLAMGEAARIVERRRV